MCHHPSPVNVVPSLMVSMHNCKCKQVKKWHNPVIIVLYWSIVTTGTVCATLLNDSLRIVSVVLVVLAGFLGAYLHLGQYFETREDTPSYQAYAWSQSTGSLLPTHTDKQPQPEESDRTRSSSTSTEVLNEKKIMADSKTQGSSVQNIRISWSLTSRDDFSVNDFSMVSSTTIYHNVCSPSTSSPSDDNPGQRIPIT
ncbi:hypothetical protein M422DRAFT_26630 [Sphaerobolus stellatus SS14]|nr:hypothetical protein M422DRAFT_26630 [Sphaerobolus stellatus SS14]